MSANNGNVSVSGIVVGLEYEEGAALPVLVLNTDRDPDGAEKAKYKVSDIEMVKVLRRVLSTGDLIECDVRSSNDGNDAIRAFRLLTKASEEPSRGRALHTEHRVKCIQFSEEQFDDHQMVNESLLELIIERAESVFSLEWDSGRMAETGVESVVRFANVYFCQISSGTFGPFRSLASALSWSELDYFSTASVAISCTEVEAQSIAELLIPRDDVAVGYELQVNDETWKLGDGARLVRAR